MFEKRAQMRTKKDLQQYMKEKLAKTKIKEDQSTKGLVIGGSTMGPRQKNFEKKKSTEASSIYKPNLHKKATSSSKTRPPVQRKPEERKK